MRRSWLAALFTLCVIPLTHAGGGIEEECAVFFDDMETGAPGWTSAVRGEVAAKVAEPPGPDTWHLSAATCMGDDLGDTMYLSNGNAGAACSADSARDRSQLLSPLIELPFATQVVLEFDALSFDEGGICTSDATFDKKDVGLTTDGGATYQILNDCTRLTDGSGQRVHNTFDISSFAGQTVQVIFVYDTVDQTRGHTFAVDNVLITTDGCRVPECGDEVVDAGETCDPPGLPAGGPDVCRDDCTFCGDGRLDLGEECDDGNNLDGDACSADCRIDGSGCLVFEDDMESGGREWLDDTWDPAKIADPPGPSTWHPDRFSCRGDDLGSTMMVSNGNDGPTCTPDSARERSRLIGPPIVLPATGVVGLEFEALSFDEAGSCLGSASFDRHDVGISVDGGLTYERLNDCTALADGQGSRILHRHNISDYAGQTVQIVFLYDTVDHSFGHTFAVDNVRVVADTCPADSINVGQVEFGDRWTGVRVARAQAEPVVILGPPTRVAWDPGVVRVRSVTSDSFLIRYAEWNYRDDIHLPETASFMHLSSGRRVMPDGAIWEVGTFSMSGGGALEPFDFLEPFADAPALFLTLQTANDPDPVIVRAANVTETGFQAGLFEEEGATGDHQLEVVGYLAIQTDPRDRFGVVDIDGIERPYLLQRAEVGRGFAPVLGWNLKLDEERSADDELNHADETLDVLALGDHVFAQDVSFAEADPITIRRVDPEPTTPVEWGMVRGVNHRFTTVPLYHRYVDPIVVVRPASTVGTDPGVLRLREVGRSAFQVRFQEWDYLNVAHSREDLFYFVIEAGTHQVGDLTVEAGKLSSDATVARGGWTRVDFTTSFAESPAVFTSIQTHDGADAVTTRLTGVDTSGFEIAMQEEQAADQRHVEESLGFVAIESGASETSNGRRLETFSANVGGHPKRVFYPTVPMRSHPTLLAEIATSIGLDTCFPRYLSISRTEATVVVAEEQSRDEELRHSLETMVFLSAE